MDELDRNKYLCELVKNRYSPSDIESFLRHAMNVGGGFEDVFISIGQEIRIRSKETIYPLTRKHITEKELKDFIVKNYDEGAWTDIVTGSELDDALEIPKDPLNPRSRDYFRFRLSAQRYRQRHGGRGVLLVMRAISDDVPTFDKLNVSQVIRDNITPRQGLVLIVGETGSGKSTLMASAIEHLLSDHSSDKVIVELSAPVEYVYDNVNKGFSEIYPHNVGSRKDVKSFPAGVRAALRKNSNVIIVGECRDEETAEALLLAANIGNLAYSTLHANSVSNAIRRLVNLFPESSRPAKALEVIDLLKLVVVQYLAKVPGGRAPVQEILPVTQEMKNKLSGIKYENLFKAINDMVVEYGQPMRRDADHLLENGSITQSVHKKILSGL